MKINEHYLWRLFQRTSKWSQWIDFLGLAIYWELNFSEHFEKLDSDNSNQAFIEWEYFTFTISKSSNNRYSSLRISISVDGVAYPVIEIRDFSGKKWWFIACDYSVYVYWTLFRLIERWDIEPLDRMLCDLFDENDLHVISSARINRIDYRLDLFFDTDRRIPTINKVLSKKDTTSYSEFSLTKESHKNYKDWKNVIALHNKIKQWEKPKFTQIQKQKEWSYMNWWTIWQKKTKTVRIRMYNKLLDSLSKWKYGLFDDFFTYWSVYRLECEFRDKFCKWFLWDDFTLNNIEELVEKCKSYMWIQPKWNATYFYEPNYDLKKLNVSYINKYTKAWEKIMMNKICPYEVQSLRLIENWHSSKEIIYRLMNTTKVLQKQFWFWSDESVLV